MPFATLWIGLMGIQVSKTGHTSKGKHYRISLMWKRNKIDVTIDTEKGRMMDG